MQITRKIKGTEVQNLLTKFYYKENRLCFQILLHLGLDETIPFQEFSDYSSYKKVYSNLLDQKNSNALIEIKEKSRQISFSSVI